MDSKGSNVYLYNMRALIIVDVQYDFLPGGALAVPDGDTIIETINRMQVNYDLVVATQDWHPANHQSFASQHAGKEIFSQIEWKGLPQVLWPDHCIQETRGADLVATLNTAKIEAIFRKGMDRDIDSYSGFFDNGKRKATGMSDYLKGRGVDAVDVCGLAADYCVYYTAKDALDFGFKSSILDAATKAIDQSNYEQIKQDFAIVGGQIKTFADEL